MFALRVFFAFLFVVCLLLAAGGVAVKGQERPLGAAPTSVDSHLGGEIVVSAVDNQEYLPSVAYNWKHHEYLVVWHTRWAVGSRDIRAARISEQGQVLSSFVVYAHNTKDSAQPTVAYDSVHDRYLVVWVFDAFGNGSDWDVYGRFIPWEGPVAGLQAFPICTFASHQWTPKVAYGRTVEEFLVVWMNEDQTGFVKGYISGRRVTAANGAFPGGASDLTISHATENRIGADVDYNLARNEYLVVYENGVDIFGMRLTGDLGHNFGGEFGIAAWPGAETHPAVAACHAVDQYLVVWQADQGVTKDAVYGRFLAGNGAPGSVHQIDDATGHEREADVACNHAGDQYDVVWQKEYTNARYGIWGRLMQPNGAMRPQDALIAATTLAGRTAPAAAGGHTTYLTAWEHERDGTAYQDIHGRLATPEVLFLPVIWRR